tara:strand:- start:3702 stop:5081 length:1380 start_codon:yes stop_codon:yes gene_type:complete
MLTKLLNSKSNSFVLLLNEFVTKSFSFILFWFLGIRLLNDDLSDFLLEMPFIFLFSTVLSFGISAFFLDQKKLNKKKFKLNTSLALGLVLSINLILVAILFIAFLLTLISANHLILFLVAIAINVNSNLSEYFFTSKKFPLMALTSISPKLLFFSTALILDEFIILNKSIYYLIIISANIICSFHILFKINLKFSREWIIEYFKFSWILTLQHFLAYISYVSFRYFINFSDQSTYLIEFSILQTYMGFFALLVSVSNRFIIHNLYESLIANSVNTNLSTKFIFFNKLFFLISFLYFHVVIYYTNIKLGIGIDLDLLAGIFLMIIASLLNFQAQYFKSIIIFNRHFSYLFYVNLFSSSLTLFLSFISLILEINLLYPLVLVIVNAVLFSLYITKIDLTFFNKLIKPDFMYKMVLLVLSLFIVEYLIYKFDFNFVLFNLIILFLITFDLANFFKKKLLPNQ